MSDQKHRPNATVAERICQIFSQKAAQEAANINATAQSKQGVHVTFSAKVQYVEKSTKIAWDIRVLPLVKPAKIKGVVQDEDPDQVVMGNILAEEKKAPGVEPLVQILSEGPDGPDGFGAAPEPLSVQRAKPAKTKSTKSPRRSTKK